MHNVDEREMPVYYGKKSSRGWRRRTPVLDNASLIRGVYYCIWSGSYYGKKGTKMSFRIGLF